MLHEPIDNALMLHNLYESSSLEKGWVDKKINENLSNLSLTLSPRIKTINSKISLANKSIKGLDFDIKIPTIIIKDILEIVRGRLKTLYNAENAQKVSNSYFQAQLGKKFQAVFDGIQDFLKTISNERFKEELDKVEKPYSYTIKQALDISSIGYYSTAVFIAGKAIEELINDYYKVLFQSKLIEKFDITKMKLDDKINKLNGNNYITVDLYHKLISIKLDRNEFAHPSKKIVSKKQAHLRIALTMEVIHELYKQMQKIQKKYAKNKIK